MGRGNVIDGLVEQLRATNGFDALSSGTAVSHDHRVLALGVDRAAVVLANDGEQARQLFNRTDLTHRLDVEVYIRHNNNVVQARRDADTYVQNIIQRVNDNPTLGGSAAEALVTAYRVEDEDFRIGQVAFLEEVLTVSARENLSAAVS